MSKAFAPANVSCIFSPYVNSEPEKTGSLGVGFTVDKGVEVEVEKSKNTTISFNGGIIDFPTVKTVVESVSDEPLFIKIISELPLGVGFGLSGAASIATAFAVNDLLSLGITESELAMIAHIAEVKNKTGLGDVCGQFNGGFQIKREVGNPLKSEKLNVGVKKVYCDIFSSIDTKGTLSNRLLKERIIASGKIALDKIDSSISFAKLCELSREFAEQSTLLSPDIKFALMRSKGNSSMMMLGNAIYSDSPSGLINPIELNVVDNRVRLL
ncbi:pantoate kinase [Nanoarchaeota archaeon]